MAAKRPKKPSPVPVETVCSVCGFAWTLHGSDPTTDDCIRLLKVELAKKPVPVPYIQPYPYWVPYRERPLYKEVPRWEGKVETSMGATYKEICSPRVIETKVTKERLR